MERAIAISLTAIAFLVIVSCDFPSDPPIKKISHKTPPVTLITLEHRDVFKYMVIKEFMQTYREVIDTVATITAPNGTYYRIRYVFFDFWGSQDLEPKPVVPPYLKNDSSGLSFYYPTNPKSEDTTQLYNPVYHFRLLYPSNVGDTWLHPDGRYKTELIKKDTVVYTYDNLVAKSCWFYRVYVRVKGSLYDPYIDIFIVPGEYIFKIFHYPEDVLVNTLIWKKD